MRKRLNDLLIGKIRHNLKTHLNIVCGFSELLLDEPEDIARASDDDGLAALASISQSGDSIISRSEAVNQQDRGLGAQWRVIANQEFPLVNFA